MQFVLICLGIGCAMGFLAGLLGVGGGIIAIPCMMYFLKMGSQQAMGTSLAVIVPVALISQPIAARLSQKSFSYLKPYFIGRSGAVRWAVRAKDNRPT